MFFYKLIIFNNNYFLLIKFCKRYNACTNFFSIDINSFSLKYFFVLILSAISIYKSFSAKAINTYNTYVVVSKHLEQTPYIFKMYG